MNRCLGHIALPLLPAVFLVALYFCPKESIGCRNIGIIALSIALFSVIAALVAGARADVLRRTDKERAQLWLLSAVILVLPLALLVGPLR